jgi:hypothetical protein
MNASDCFIGVTPDNTTQIPQLNDIIQQTRQNLLDGRSSPFLGAQPHFVFFPDEEALQKAYLNATGRMWSGTQQYDDLI